MPAAQKIGKIKKLGIIAGGGSLPAHLLSVCQKNNIDPYLIAIEGQADLDLTQNAENFIWAKIGFAGKIIKFFKDQNVSDLVLIGSIKRPKLSELKADLKGMQLISRIGLKSMGDSTLLDTVKYELQKEGFMLHGVHEFCDQLLVKEGVIGNLSPKQEDTETITLGLKASQGIGALDIGQSVIVQDGRVIGVEGVEGTDNLIKRCEPLLRKGRDAILVKTCKPQQDNRLDLPTIGLQTIINAHKYGLSGIVLQAQKVLIIDPESIAQHANQYKMFVIGMTIQED